MSKELIAKALDLAKHYIGAKHAEWSHVVKEEDLKTVEAAIAALAEGSAPISDEEILKLYRETFEGAPDCARSAPRSIPPMFYTFCRALIALAASPQGAALPSLEELAQMCEALPETEIFGTSLFCDQERTKARRGCNMAARALRKLALQGQQAAPVGRPLAELYGHQNAICEAAYQRACLTNKEAADALRPAFRAIIETGLGAVGWTAAPPVSRDDVPLPELPMLPDPAMTMMSWIGDYEPSKYYVAHQMREYASRAVDNAIRSLKTNPVLAANAPAQNEGIRATGDGATPSLMDWIRAEGGRKPLPDYGELMPVAEFEAAVKDGSFIPYDGTGYFATTEFMDVGTNAFNERPDWATHVMWFNR